MTYLLLFCRFTLLILFGLACAGKLYRPAHFSHALRRLKLARQRLTPGLATIIIGSELLVVVCLARGAELLRWGFGLAALLLLIFSLGLLVVLRRGLRAPCACFGLSEKPISAYDIWRNMLSLLLALSGLALLATPHEAPSVETLDILIMTLASLVYAFVLTQFGALFAALASPTPPVKPKHN